MTDTPVNSTTDKKTTRQDAKVTRLDVRLPNDLHATIEAIAQANGEPRHHITGNIILTPTVVKLIRLGVASLSGDYPTLADISTTTGQVSDNLAPRMQAVESEVSILKKHLCSLEDKLNVLIVSDGLVILADTLPDSSATTLPDKLPDTSPDNLTDNSADTITDGLADSITDILSDVIADISPNKVPDNIPRDVKSDNLSDIVADNLSDTLKAPLPKKFEALSQPDRIRTLELLRDGVPTEERNNGLGEIFGWQSNKTFKSRNEDASRLKKALKDAGLIS